jgi:hypothetical protein
MTNQHPRHDRKSFFKYTTASTAIKILESAKVRYSSPLLFNDPFEIQSGLHFDFDIDSLPERLIDRMEALVTAPEEPQFLDFNDFSKSVIYMRAQRSQFGFPKHELAQLIAPVLQTLSLSAKIAQQGYQNYWWTVFLPRLRVFSVTETNDNLLMWSHYAKDHTGVVFEFRVMPEVDNPLCVAGPIRYVRHPPSFFTQQEWIDSNLGIKELNPTRLYYEYAYAKSEIWAYEREWRVWDLSPNVDEPHYKDYDLRQNEIAAIYLGCRIKSEDREVIEQLRSKLYPNAQMYQSRRSTEEFSISFAPC